MAMLFDARKLSLAGTAPIGMGNRRRVFRHPENGALCIKIARLRHIRQQMDARSLFHKMMPTRWRDDNRLEVRAYRQSAIRGGEETVWRHLPRLYGWQDTDLGRGLVFDYFQNHDGGPAPTLRQALDAQGDVDEVKAALDELYDFIRSAGIWMRHPNVENVVLAADGRLKLIDCLGTYNGHVRRLVPPLVRRRLERHVSYLSRQVGRLLEGRG